MVSQSMSELSILVIEAESILGSDIYRHLAGHQAGLIFLTQDLQN